MKFNKFLFGAAALSMGVFASCSSDEPVKGPDVVEVDQTRYLSVQISSPSETSRGFDQGTANESKVDRLDFIFYDAAGNPTSTPQTFTRTGLDGEFDNNNGGGYEEGNVIKIWTSVVPVNMTQGQNLPAQLICLVNATAERFNVIKGMTLDQLRDEEVAYFNNGEDFLMSNSVYFGQDVLTGQANQRLCATPINANSQLYGTPEEAEDAIKNAANEDADKDALVNVYVERLASKVGFTMGADAVKPYTLQNGEGEGTVSLTFVPDYWFMNATANENYVTKRYGVVEGTTIVMKPTFAQVNAVLWNGWNDAPRHRSYWACSPSYYDATYPLVSDQVNDLEDGTEETVYSVKYYSFNEVKAEAAKTGIAKQALAPTDGAFAITNTGDAATGYIYARETTTSINNINNINEGNPAASVAAAVLVGHYTVGGATESSTFYVDRNAGEGGTYYATAEGARKTLADRQFIVFQDANGQTAAPANTFVVKHPDAATRAKLANGNIAGRLVTIQIETLPETAVYYWNGTAYVAVTAANLAEVNAQLVSVGYMDMFNNGRAFFSVPIRHLNFQTSSYADGKYNWGELKVGELGLVRNHLYQLTVSSIAGLGTGLRSDDQPIVPAKDEVNQYIAMRLNILAWNIVPSWSVDL